MLLIWQAASKANAVLVSKDADLVERTARLGPPPHAIWLTCGNTSEVGLRRVFGQRFQSESYGEWPGETILACKLQNCRLTV